MCTLFWFLRLPIHQLGAFGTLLVDRQGEVAAINVALGVPGTSPILILNSRLLASPVTAVILKSYYSMQSMGYAACLTLTTLSWVSGTSNALLYLLLCVCCCRSRGAYGSCTCRHWNGKSRAPASSTSQSRTMQRWSGH